MPLVIVAGRSGQHARVVYEAAILSGLAVAGFITLDYGPPPVVLDCPFLGGRGTLEAGALPSDASFVVAIGDNAQRRAAAEYLERQGRRLQTVVHPRAIVSPSAAIGDGTAILAGAIVGPSAAIGRCCIVNHAASADHDVTLGEFCNISPGARAAGTVTLEEGVFLGVNAAILPGLRIGRDAVVGAGAVVIRDVAAGMTVVGNPARELKR